METLSALLAFCAGNSLSPKWKHFPRYWPFERRIHRSPLNSPRKGQWRGTFMLSLICVWIHGRVNNREAGDLRRHRAHYDIIVIRHWLVTVDLKDIGSEKDLAHFRSVHLANPYFVDSSWPSDAIWRLKSWSTLVYVMTCSWHQAITWTNVDFSSLNPSDIQLRGNSTRSTSVINY